MCEKFNNCVTCILSSDFNIPSAQFPNVYSYFDERLAHSKCFQLICIKNNKNTVLDLNSYQYLF